MFVYPLAAWLFLTARTSEASLRAGIMLALLGEALRLWANGYVGHRKVNWTQRERNDARVGQLITAGPYAFVRNPLYVGTFVIGVGLCVVVQNAWLALGALACFWVLYGRKARQEEQLIREELGAAYAAYARAVDPWFPWRGRYAHRQGQWSWEGIRASKEIKTVIWVMVTLLALYLREEWIQEQTLFNATEWSKHAVAVACAIGLVVWEGIGELRRRRTHVVVLAILCGGLLSLNGCATSRVADSPADRILRAQTRDAPRA